MNVALWIAQVLLAAAFAIAGTMKTTMPIAALGAESQDGPEISRQHWFASSELASNQGLLPQARATTVRS